MSDDDRAAQGSVHELQGELDKNLLGKHFRALQNRRARKRAWKRRVVKRSSAQTRKEMPLQRRKRYATAGLKAAQMYKAQKPNWSKLMTTASEQYTRERESGKRTKREHENWPVSGYKALKKLADEMHTEVIALETKKNWNNRDLYHYQKYLIVRFYSTYALRGDLADVRIKRPFGANYLSGTKGKHKMHIGEHKTARARGAILRPIRRCWI